MYWVPRNTATIMFLTLPFSHCVDRLLAAVPEVRVLPDFLRSSGSGTGSTQPREYN
jgi:hypothetical protein